jgi:hypothetical protein
MQMQPFFEWLLRTTLQTGHVSKVARWRETGFHGNERRRRRTLFGRELLADNCRFHCKVTTMATRTRLRRWASCNNEIKTGIRTKGLPAGNHSLILLKLQFSGNFESFFI